ncbi:uncharacterized protein C2845_PM08G30680 [Panicum miliaceum]|uniref:Uncharacterized protein n=1 Tax=Panicum miliaceum TaxID=4540 RepID=A0A3L6QXX1_PANMI|nr:uncharacterized protein C2845_PM08G30680 [Panicum miliaceum]
MQLQHNGLLAIFSLSVVSVLISGAHLSGYAVNDSYRLSRLFPDYLNPRGPLQFGFVHAMLCRCGLHGARCLTSQTPSRQHWGVDLSGSASFSTTFTSSHSASSLPSTDFDTESAWSLSRRRGGGGGGGMTLASLIGLVDAMESRRRPSARAGRSGRLRALLLSLCLRSHLDNGSGRRRSASSSRWRGEPVAPPAMPTGSD